MSEYYLAEHIKKEDYPDENKRVLAKVIDKDGKVLFHGIGYVVYEPIPFSDGACIPVWYVSNGYLYDTNESWTIEWVSFEDAFSNKSIISH